MSGAMPLLFYMSSYRRDGQLYFYLFFGGSVGQPGLGFSTGDFEIWLKGALEVECLSLWEVCDGNLEAGLPCFGP